MEFSSTKDRIIYQAIIQFGAYGYQNVSMRQIASAVGITAGSIYNHFTSKDEILDAVIDLYWEIFSNYHPTFDELKRLAYTIPAREILRKFCYVYKPEHVLPMLYLLRIQFVEQFSNEKIRKLVFDTLLDGRMREMAELLELLMKLGKIPPGNSATLAQLWTSTMCVAAMRGAHGIEAPQQDLEEFGDINNYMIDLICGKEAPEPREEEPDAGGRF